MSRIQAREKNVRELLSNAKYGIDFYQREYEWERRHVEELLDDFEAKFSANFASGHKRSDVNNYTHYFLGTIITIVENGQSLIVDGQQRLTTLTLLLIHAQHHLEDIDDIGNCRSLIYSSKGGVKSFNINIPERLDCISGLFEQGDYLVDDQSDLSVRKLVARYADIEELFPDTLQGDVLPYFFDWLTENVDLVDIRAYTDDDAFTIFETMNDRGVNLSQVDMLKGYLLANINDADPAFMQKQKAKANDIWKGIIKELVDLGGDSEVAEFFKTWLRAQYACSQRASKKDAKNGDFENIDKFHRWVRDKALAKEANLNLETSEDFYDFIGGQMRRFSNHYIRIRQAAHHLNPGLEAVNFNANNNFTLQYMLALAPLRLEDDENTIQKKIRVVATFADIYFVRRVVNFKNTGYSTLRYSMFNLTREIRDTSLDELREILLNYLDNMREGTLSGLDNFALHGRNKNHVRYLLARMTAWVEQQTGNTVNYRNFLWDAKGKTIDIEHIWANKYVRHQDEYSHEFDFQRERNLFGGLVLLVNNKALGADPYEDKREHYIKENLLAASLHPLAYEKFPKFKHFRERTKLPFKSHAQFKRADLLERQELYRQICEQIWSPDRLNAI